MDQHDFDELARAVSAVNAAATAPRPEPGDYAELVDESQPEGMVVVRRADGTPVMWMPRAVWDALRGS